MAPIKSVGVVGAGISGVSAAAHLLKHGFDVVVFERSSTAGGVWVFDPRRDKDPDYPIISSDDDDDDDDDNNNNNNNNADQKNDNDDEDVVLAHAPPGPCYEGLMNNVPTTMMRSTLLDWPPGTPEHVTHREIEDYVQTLARTTGAHAVTRYNTRVEEAVKQRDDDGSGDKKWVVRTKTLVVQSQPGNSSAEQGRTGGVRFDAQTWRFDALVVAAGHYHVPLIPRVPGLAAWKRRCPTRVMHSKSYRAPGDFRDQDVLLVGAGVSSLDIAKELDGVARRTYQSSRGGVFDLDRSLLPANSERVGGLRAFCLDDDGGDGTAEGAPIPGAVHLADGRVLTGIHQVILATGYQTTYPFLTGLESDTVPVEAASDTVLITADKCVTHNLHQDIFYIPDPTLSFVGVPYYTSTFSLFDFQAEVVARVYAGWAALPSEHAMRAAHRARKAAASRRGEGGKAFHSLLKNQVEYMRDNLAWVNEGAAGDDGRGGGVAPMRGVDEAWYRALEDFKAQTIRLLPENSTQVPQPVASKYYQDVEPKTAVKV